jgi:hypothetical protein
MKRNRFTEEQIIGALREQEAGTTVAELCRRHGMSSATHLSLEGEVRRDFAPPLTPGVHPEEKSGPASASLQRGE